MLLAGAAANFTSAEGGALSFNVIDSPSSAGWSVGSANKFSLLVRVLPILLSAVVILRLMCPFIRHGQGGTSVPLLFI